MLVGDAFSPLRSALEGAGIRYAVGGSWATTAFGEPRFTNNVDIIADFTEGSLDRAVFLADTGLSERMVRSPRCSGAISGASFALAGPSLDRGYLERNAAKLGIAALLEKALTEI